MALTRRQKQVLDFLVTFINRRGYSPSFEEIGKGLDVSSLATVHKHLDTLEKKGFIRRGYNQSRSVEVIAVPGSIPFARIALRAAGSSGRRKAGAAASHKLAPARSPDELEFPLLGRIAAGQPVEAISNPETFSLRDFSRGKDNILVLRVKGDS